MKKFIKIALYTILSIIAILYFCFLFVLPKAIDINKYKPELQKIVKEYTDLNIDFDEVKIITSPFLEAGIKTKNIKVTLPDNSTLLSIDAFKGKVFLPSLLWLSVRVTCAEIESPDFDIEIINSEKYKVAKVYEDLINKKREQRRLNPPEELSEEANQPPFDISSIKLFIPAIKINNYNILVDDVKAQHSLTLKGDSLKIGYYNGKVAKLKTKSELLSDDKTNITADLDITTFIPQINIAKEEDDDEAVYEIPFVNPVTQFRNYDLKSDINTKLKIKKNEKNNKIWAKGYLNIDNTNVTLSGLQLPSSYFNLKANGYSADIDTKLYVTNEEYLTFLGKIGFGNSPYVDCALKSTKVQLNNLLKITQAYLDTIHVKNNIAQMNASGYLFSNFNLKTNLKDIESKGKFIIRNGNINDKNIGLLFKDITANISFDNNIINIAKTHLLINQQPLDISGKIDSESIENFKIYADKIPLPELYLAFAPKNIKSAYKLNSGFFSINAELMGEIKNTSAFLKATLEDLNISDTSNNIIITNKYSNLGIGNILGKIDGRFNNKGLVARIPSTNSTISDDTITANIDNSKIEIQKSDIKLNNNSKITFSGIVKKYLANPDIKIAAKGNLSDKDILNFIGNEIAPYFTSKGNIPIKANFNAKNNNFKFITQLQTDANSFVTPVQFDELLNKTLLLQLQIEKHNNTIKLNKSGLFKRHDNAKFSDKLNENLIGAKEIVSTRAIISNLNTTPFINLFKLHIHKNLNGTICIFPNSKFNLTGNAHAYGNLNNPKINGTFNIMNLNIPEIYTTARNITLTLRNKDIEVNVFGLDANGSDFLIKATSNWDLLSKQSIANVKVFSRLIDIDKITKVSDSLLATIEKTNPTSGNTHSEPADIPIEIATGNINLKRIKTGNIIVDNTTGKISLFKNILYVNGLKTKPLGGKVNGNVAMNLITTELNAKLSGKDFDIDKLLVDVMGMKDTLSGQMNFITDISMKGLTNEEQMKTLKGYLDFNITNGQLGPFGKFENFLMAENIRNNAFFSSTIGSVITKLVTFDTARFNNLYGHLTFEDGFATISPIKSQGDVMSMFIFGKVGLLDNSADLKVRGKLASAFSDSLGPLANINPINLIKHTPGLNIVAAKTFSVFCEAVSTEEMKAIPSLAEGKSDEYATKFQIVLRGDTRKPLKMIKSFKWLALNSEIESAQNFIDTIPIPEAGEENLSVEEIIQKREEQAAAEAEAQKLAEQKEKEAKTIKGKIKHLFKK